MYSGSSLTFLAASIPRFVRTAQLSHLRIGAIIGSWAIENKNDLNLVFDVIMLPKHDFMRMRAQLSTPFISSPALSRSGTLGSYIPKDIKQIDISPLERHPHRAAALHFIREFGLDINRTIYADDTSVAATVATRTMNSTSCTRMISAPRKVLRATRAAVPSRRSPTGLLRAFPMNDFREGPTITG